MAKDEPIDAKAKKRADQLVDREAATLEYEARQRAARANLERLRDQRLIREAAAKATTKAAKKAKPSPKRKARKPAV